MGMGSDVNRRSLSTVTYIPFNRRTVLDTVRRGLWGENPSFDALRSSISQAEQSQLLWQLELVRSATADQNDKFKTFTPPRGWTR